MMTEEAKVDDWVWGSLKTWFQLDGCGFAGLSSAHFGELCDCAVLAPVRVHVHTSYERLCTFVRLQNKNPELFRVEENEKLDQVAKCGLVLSLKLGR